MDKKQGAHLIVTQEAREAAMQPHVRITSPYTTGRVRSVGNPIPKAALWPMREGLRQH